MGEIAVPHSTRNVALINQTNNDSRYPAKRDASKIFSDRNALGVAGGSSEHGGWQPSHDRTSLRLLFPANREIYREFCNSRSSNSPEALITQVITDV